MDQANVLLSYPIVYVHFWPADSYVYTKRGHTYKKQRYNVYIGESNDIISRTREHYAAGDKPSNWQYHLVNDKETPQLIVIGHEHFNKSLTLDIENRLIEYMMSSSQSVKTIYNGRGNPQYEYYPVEEFDSVFHNVWKKLRRINDQLFRSETEIEHSALFKASPLKKLTDEQLEAKEVIIAKIFEAIEKGGTSQLIFVQGEAGTGKTVLNSSLFYELVTRGEEYFGHKLDCHLMVNHDQQVTVYEHMAERLDLGSDVVHKPTSFINSRSPRKKVDVSFIDEGHLLLTQGKQSYQGSNQLDDIIQRSKVTVVMFDEYQVLTAEEYWEPDVLERFKSLAYNQNNYITLSSQLRMNCSSSTVDWINSFVLKGKLLPFIKDEKYEVASFDSPKELYLAIKNKANIEEYKLSRLVASYDWPYSSVKRPSKGLWGVRIGDWFLPWNYETKEVLSSKEKRGLRYKAWAEQSHTINEVGSTFTIQGFDLSYVGVILGPSVKYIDGKIVFDPSESRNNKAKQKRTLSDGTTRISFGETFIRNEVKVLMTRGVKGLYIYACNPELRAALKGIARL